MSDDQKRSEAAKQLREALTEAEAGRNEHGVYWQTTKLVKALRKFYKEYDDSI